MDEDNKPKSFTEQISSSFFKGLLIVVPPAITVFVVTWLFELTESTIGKYLPAKIPGAGLAIVLVGIWIVGVLSGNFLSKKNFGVLRRTHQQNSRRQIHLQIRQASFKGGLRIRFDVQKRRARALSKILRHGLSNPQRARTRSRKARRRLRLRLHALEHEHDGRHEFLREKIRRDSARHAAAGRVAIYFDGGHNLGVGAPPDKFG